MHFETGVSAQRGLTCPDSLQHEIRLVIVPWSDGQVVDYLQWCERLDDGLCCLTFPPWGMQGQTQSSTALVVERAGSR